MTMKFLFAWYDLWVGVYIDTKNQRVCVLPIPCCGVVIDYSKPSHKKQYINGEFSYC